MFTLLSVGAWTLLKKFLNLCYVLSPEQGLTWVEKKHIETIYRA